MSDVDKNELADGYVAATLAMRFFVRASTFEAAADEVMALIKSDELTVDDTVVSTEAAAANVLNQLSNDAEYALSEIAGILTARAAAKANRENDNG